MTTAEEIMDDPVFVEHDATVEEVVEKVRGAEDTLIVRKDGRFVGEIHEHDLLKVIIPEDRLDEEKVVGILGLSFDRSYAPEDAHDLMNQHEVTVKLDEEVGEIAFLMEREDVRAIPVKEGDEIVGVVHENSLMGEL